MSKEQNIDDILKLLKNSVSNEFNISEPDDSYGKSDSISEELLKDQLKSQFLNDNVTPSEATEREYVIDADFLSEAEEESTSGEVVSEVSVIVEEEIAESDNSSVTDTEEEKITEIIDGTDVDIEEDLPRNNVDELIESLRPIENMEMYDEEEEEIISDVQPHGTIDIEALMNVPNNPQNDDKAEPNISVEIKDEEWDEFVAEETLSDSAVEEEILEPISEASENVMLEEEPQETFIASMRKIGIDFSSDENDEAVAVEEDKETEIAAVEVTDDFVGIQEEDLDLSTINLMMQFCEKDELSDAIGKVKIEEFLQNEQNDGYKYSSVDNVKTDDANIEQSEKIEISYKRNSKIALFSMLGCCVLSLISFIIELLPILNAKTTGIFDYVEYPAVYSLIGLQLVAFSAAICYKQLWSGLKRAFSLSPNRHSLVAVVLGVTAVYDLIIVIILAFSHDEIHYMFNSVAAFTVAMSAVADYLDIKSWQSVFSVCTSQTNQYTLVNDASDGGIAEKMYVGGLERDKKVFTVSQADFKNGIAKKPKYEKSNAKLLTVSIISVFVLGIIAIVASIIRGADAYSATAAFMLSLYAVLPIGIIFADSIPFAVVSGKLAKRGNAIIGKDMIDRYKKCDVMVFGDLHMFKKCRTEDVGIAIYDTSVGYLALGCIGALYSKIGGPLSGMQMNLPDVFKFDNVKIRRITRTGIEAIIDNKHVLIVGERAFLQRYGLSFPADEKVSDRSSLCVSLNGKITAKLSVKYQPEPVFEMLVERLYSEGISCAIATYDPLINSSMITSSRTLGNAPISVIHKNAEDYYKDCDNEYRSEPDGIVACSSRLKLVEVEIWLKRLASVIKMSSVTIGAFLGLGVAALALLIGFNLCGYVSSFHVLGFIALELMMISAYMLLRYPSKNYFTIDQLYIELERESQKTDKKEKTKKDKENKK